jgi:hypothetical protein
MPPKITNACVAGLLVLTLFSNGCMQFRPEEPEPASGWMEGELVSRMDIGDVRMLVVKVTACSEGLEETLGQQRAWPEKGGGLGAKPGDRLRATATVTKGDAVVIKSIRRLPPVFVERQLKIQQRWQGPYNGRKDAGNEIIESREDFEKLWKVIYSFVVPRPDLPDIDLEKNVIVAAFMGEFPTSGYGIEIEKVVEKEKEVVVYIARHYPPPGSDVAQALSSPYCMVAFEKTGKPITFAGSETGTAGPEHP